MDVFYALLDALLFILHSHNSLVGLTVISISVVMIVFIGFASYIYFFNNPVVLLMSCVLFVDPGKGRRLQSG